jgi:hypothetical protein
MRDDAIDVIEFKVYEEPGPSYPKIEYCPKPQWFDLVKVQAFTGLPIHDLKERIRSGRLPARTIGSRYEVHRDDLAWLIREVTGKTARRVEYELDLMT